jgi:CheY-like chemotaxis protein
MPIHNKILIADDDAEMLQTLSFMLEREGYAVIRAENGLEAVELARKELPALVMLDVHMPRMDGLNACREIKADQVTKGIPVVMLTVEGSINEIQQAISYGATTYITKPSSNAEILKVVKNIIY